MLAMTHLARSLSTDLHKSVHAVCNILDAGSSKAGETTFTEEKEKRRLNQVYKCWYMS